MHPIERLRWVARSPEGDVSMVAAEAADALAAFADDPAGLVIASRRLIERRPASAPLWWLASRVLCALDPAFEAMDAAADLERDRTPVALAGDLPGGTIAIVGWPDQAGAALRMRGRMGGRRRRSRPGRGRSPTGTATAGGCADWLQGHGVDARLLRAGEVDAAARRSVLALLEADRRRARQLPGRHRLRRPGRRRPRGQAAGLARRRRRTGPARRRSTTP